MPSDMTVLILGSGGREHALAWKFAQSPQTKRLIVVPGNDGMPVEWERWDFSFSGQTIEQRQSGFLRLAQKAVDEKVDLAFIGPDNALADGIVNVFEKFNIPTVGPKSEAARIESSKAFGKDVMRAAGVPTAQYWVASTEEEAHQILKSTPQNAGWVVKADGLALGKGVRVCETLDEALHASSELIAINFLMPKLSPRLFPKISTKLVLEERLQGEEISWMAFCDGERCALLEPARDFKRLLDGNTGPNTGGMGAISPVPGIPEGFAETVRNRIFLPVLKEMKKRDCEFRGVLYAGIMADFVSGNFWVLEFNARFGDPETQVLLPRMQGDLYPWCKAMVRDGSLEQLPAIVPFVSESATVVVAASEGYPECPETGRAVRLPLAAPGSPYFFSGVRREGGQLLTSGGRVVCALGMGKSLEDSRASAYENLGRLSFEGMHFRSDIGGGEGEGGRSK